MKNVNLENLNDADILLLRSIINKHNAGDTPVCTTYNIKYFTQAYVKSCIRKSLKDLTPEYREIARAMLKVI